MISSNISDSASLHMRFSFVGLRYVEKPLTSIEVTEGGDKITMITADGYEGAELVCSLADIMNIGWKRNGIMLDLGDTDGFSVS